MVALAGLARAEPTALPEPRTDGTRVFSPSDEARTRPKKPTITYWTVTVTMDVEPTAEPGGNAALSGG